MNIKEIDIDAFGGLKKIKLKFIKGINLIYGENEAGKSTIQNFIKIWLYGFSSYRGKNLIYNERLRYMPLSGERIGGILTVEVEGRDYKIVRSFGRTKKDDEVKVIDSLSGEDLTNIYGYKPGEKILGVNKSTFIKTLFIGQLSVEIKRDGEEKIIDKMVNFVGSNEEEASIQKAFSKINEYIKAITNIRRNGSLDIAREKRGRLEIEKLEAYRIHESNIENEEKLLILKDKRNSLKRDIEDLILYKKYLKVAEIKEKYTNSKNKKIELERYIYDINKIQKEINNLEYKKEEYTKNIDKLCIIEEIGENLDELLEKYKSKLNEIKSIYEDVQRFRYEKKYVIGLFAVINILSIIIIKNIVITIAINMLIASYYIYDRFFNKKSIKYRFYNLSKEIKSIENTLNMVKQRLEIDDYGELFKKINLYYKCKEYKKIIEEKIIEKNNEIEFLKVKFQMSESSQNEKENKYLAEKINEIKSEDKKNLDDEFFKNLSISMENKLNLKELSILDKKDKVEKEIDSYNSKILNSEKEVMNLENVIKSSFYGKRLLAEIEEDIINIDCKIDDLKKKLKAGELARDTMKKAYLEIRDDFGPQLNEKLLERYNKISNSEYDNIQVSDEYEMNLIKDTAILDDKLLSNGSRDQLFLSLRLSFIDIIFNKSEISLFLDDAFVQYDDKKLKSALSFLLNEGYGQQLIFTCQNREQKIIEGLGIEFNYIQIK